MKPYFEYVKIPDLKQLSLNMFKVMPQELMRGNIFKDYNPNDFLKAVPGLVEAVELIGPWDQLCVVSLIAQHPKAVWPIHVDGDNHNVRPGVAFNIPVYNCENCYTVMYESIDNVQPVSTLTPTNNPYKIFELDQVKEVAVINYQNHAVLINTAKPHTIVNPTNRPRIVASFRWNPPIRWN